MTTLKENTLTAQAPIYSTTISNSENTKEALTAFACLTFFPVLYLIGNFIFN